MASYSTGMILTVDGGVTLARPGPVDPAPPSLRPPPTLGGVAGARVPAPAPSVQPETPDGARQWGQPRFRAKRVLVTGGDSGIGLAAVQAFYLECAQVLMVGHSESKTRAAHAEVSALGTPAACAGSAPSVAWAAADISNESQVTSVMKRMLSSAGWTSR
ncbi:unnamed protein product [Prorocentrum cordatum]|uniref:Protochlorophyllide reductase n=1 Tax=Prorocentrum cordatum TaxID=2364126 RepID=A0ABN9XH15_9DINO|nr:unnamed protein product [Polarella glacialis]